MYPILNDATFKLGVLGRYGFDLYNLLVHEIPGQFVFLDIGANNGLYSFIAQKNCNCKRVDAFEPNPFVFNFLEINNKKNGGFANLHNVANGDTNKKEQ